MTKQQFLLITLLFSCERMVVGMDGTDQASQFSALDDQGKVKLFDSLLQRYMKLSQLEMQQNELNEALKIQVEALEGQNKLLMQGGTLLLKQVNLQDERIRFFATAWNASKKYSYYMIGFNVLSSATLILSSIYFGTYCDCNNNTNATCPYQNG